MNWIIAIGAIEVGLAILIVAGVIRLHHQHWLLMKRTRFYHRLDQALDLGGRDGNL